MGHDQFNGPIRGSLVTAARQPSSSVSLRSGSRGAIRWVQFHVRRFQCVRARSRCSTAAKAFSRCCDARDNRGGSPFGRCSRCVGAGELVCEVSHRRAEGSKGQVERTSRRTFGSVQEILEMSPEIFGASSTSKHRCCCRKGSVCGRSRRRGDVFHKVPRRGPRPSANAVSAVGCDRFAESNRRMSARA